MVLSILLCIGWCLLILVPFTFCDVRLHLFGCIWTFCCLVLSCATQKVSVIRKTRWPGLDKVYWESEVAGSVQAECRTLFRHDPAENPSRNNSLHGPAASHSSTTRLIINHLDLDKTWGIWTTTEKTWRQHENRNSTDIWHWCRLKVIRSDILKSENCEIMR